MLLSKTQKFSKFATSYHPRSSTSRPIRSLDGSPAMAEGPSAPVDLPFRSLHQSLSLQITCVERIPPSSRFLFSPVSLSTPSPLPGRALSCPISPPKHITYKQIPPPRHRVSTPKSLICWDGNLASNNPTSEESNCAEAAGNILSYVKADPVEQMGVSSMWEVCNGQEAFSFGMSFTFTSTRFTFLAW